MIVLFAYAFPHRKSQDFLLNLAMLGVEDVVVLAAPWQQLKTQVVPVQYPKTLVANKAFDTKLIADRLGYPYYEVAHNDLSKIRSILSNFECNLGLIAGARILKAEIIELFEFGIVNFHPGKLPETAGLDAIFYTIKSGISAGVTTHFIDHRVDAGRQISFREVSVGLHDTLESVQENLYTIQIDCLRDFISSWIKRSIRTFDISRPSKNNPMSYEEKNLMLQKFALWRSETSRKQTLMQLMKHCEIGDVDKALDVLGKYPTHVSSRDDNGWTPLICSVYNQQFALTRELLIAGADPNATGKKGTTPLMYAKTRIVSEEREDFGILDLLIEYGADVLRKDMFGKSVLDYIDKERSPILFRYFEGKIRDQKCS